MSSPLYIVYIALSVYLFCMVIWALMSWLDQLSPATAANPSVRVVRGFLDSIVQPYVRLWGFVPQPAGVPIDFQSLAAFLSVVVLQRVLVAVM